MSNASFNARFSYAGDGTLMMKITDSSWRLLLVPTLFGEVAEALVDGIQGKLCIDLSAFNLVTSSMFGVLINIVDAAAAHGVNVTFRMTADAIETAKMLDFDKRANIEIAGPEAD